MLKMLCFIFLSAFEVCLFSFLTACICTLIHHKMKKTTQEQIHFNIYKETHNIYNYYFVMAVKNSPSYKIHANTTAFYADPCQHAHVLVLRYAVRKLWY